MVKTSDSYITKEEEKLEATIKYSRQFNTGFNFLKTHYGFREGKIHGLLGLTGGGKSTLIRSIMVDLYKYNSSILRTMVWLSEETEKAFKIELIGTPLTEFNRRHICCLSEKNKENRDESLDDFLLKIREEKPEMLIIDNITTSRFYKRSLNDQMTFCDKLKDLVEELEIPCLVVIHTHKGIRASSRKMIDTEDVRGCMEIGMVAEIFYVIQQLMVEGQLITTLRVTKQRGYSKTDNTFSLEFDEIGTTRTFLADKKISYEKLEEYFKIKNKR